ncbi:MAG: rhomboid family intramembrane serine protease [Deltaproteobacteria bacterium]|nr:rhomboid family intramembrane serine protease [Deltaproteobacteria bacterium]
MWLPILCPNCRKLIRSDEHACRHCGLLRPGERWRRNFPAVLQPHPDDVIRDIIYLNAFFYLLSLLLVPAKTGISGNPLRMLSPSDESLFALGATGTFALEGMHRWWTLVAANYLHGGVLHIVFNMMALAQIGPLVIREYGASRMVTLYTLGGVFGFMVSYLAHTPFTLGASGAVCSLIGSALYYGKSRGGAYGHAVFHGVWGWALGILLFGFVMPGIDNWAHGGGMAAGFLLGAALGYQERGRENAWHRRLATGCVLATLAILAWAAATGLTGRLLG